jgi:cytochrome c peroxidase
VGREIKWLGVVCAGLLLCAGANAQALSAAEWQAKAKALFGTLPTEATSPANPVTDAKIALGRTLYYDARLSKNQHISCNSCHPLAHFGADGEPTSSGHKGQRGDRNSPTSLNAALHLAQFWDGRAADVEAQAKGPILNPVEMAMPSEAAVLAVLDSIPGYAPMFAAAFPGEAKPITYDHLARAIGAFERRLITPAPLDRFIAGDAAALSDAQLAGLARFVDTGCTTCHVGPAVGGGMYQKLGLVKPYATQDAGREKVTGNAADRGVFKVPSLRNVAKTGPYFHDGSVATLPEAVRLMARHQLGRELDEKSVNEIVSFLGALVGTVDAKYVAMPALPANGPKTPKPDPG